MYRTDIPLEDSVECALKLVEFENVQRYPDKNNQDITFTAKGKKFISEVKGKSKEAEKADILQLDGWVKAEVEKGTEPDTLVGMLFINHFRGDPPDQRGEFLGQHAKRFAKMYRFKVLTTVRLFQLVQQVLQESLTKEKARDLITEGENYD